MKGIVLYGVVSGRGRKITRRTATIPLLPPLFVPITSQFGFQIGLSASVSQVIYSRRRVVVSIPLGRWKKRKKENSCRPSCVERSDNVLCKTQSVTFPPLPLYKPSRIPPQPPPPPPPINTGWLGDLSSRAPTRRAST